MAAEAQKRAFCYLIFIKRKSDGTIKSRGVPFTSDKDSSKTMSLEQMMA